MTKNADAKLTRADKLCREASALEDAGDIRRAVKLYRVAAKLGEEIAQINLAVLLEDKVKPPRLKEAIYWNKRAVRVGSYPAAWNLAMTYLNRGVQRWYLHWLKVAARLGDEDAKKLLSRRHRKTLKTRSALSRY